MSLSSKLKTLLFFFKKRRIVAQYKLFFGEEWLEISVDSIASHIYKIIMVVSDVAWGDDINNPKVRGDDLNPILERLKQKYPSKIVILKGSWGKQHDQVQFGLDYIKKNVKKASHCLYVDGDEIYTEKQLQLLLATTKKWKSFNCAIRINYNTYFKSLHYRIWPIKYPQALSLFPLRNWIQYRNARNVNARIIERPDLFFEHPAYVRKDPDKIKNKMMAHKESEPIIDDWFDNVWLKWTPEVKNFHPTIPDMWESVEEVDIKLLPEKMVKEYNKWGQGK